MILIGDIALNGLFTSDPFKNKGRFEDILKLDFSSDLILANLECPLYVKEGINKNKNLIHTSDTPTTKSILNLLNISCVSLANNHIYDCTMSGLKATINLLDEIDVYHTGAGWKKEHIEPVILNEKDKKIAFLAYVDKSTNPGTEDHDEGLLINYLEKQRIIEDLNSVKIKVDYIVVSLHWGVDYSYYPTQDQRKLAMNLVDAGANIIMGHHPHTIQPYEKYKDATIFYSLGGLAFGDFIKNNERTALFKKTKKGLIVKHDLINRFNEFIGTKELKGNYLKTTKFDYEKWSKKYWSKLYKRQRSRFYYKWSLLQEKVIDRIYEYFFGYYKSPIKRLFQLKNLGKIKRLVNDYKKSK